MNNAGAVRFLDRHGALTILLAVAIQTSGAIWWASQVSTELRVLKEASIKRDIVITELATILRINSDRLTRVQTVQENVVKILDRLIVKQDKTNAPGGSGARH